MAPGPIKGEEAIRRALGRRFGRRAPLIVDELGLVHGRGRIDMAIIGRHIHGYEIKSAHDSLRRLPRQLSLYRQALQKLTLVVDERHLSAVEREVPPWCGILVVEFGPRGGIRFHRVRQARKNPELDPFKLAHLLWRNEARNALPDRVANRRALRAPRKQLYRLLVSQVSVSVLVRLIKQAMMDRPVWRDRLQLS